MPQLNQLAEVALSQFFWLLVVIGLVYFGIARAMVPKIQSTVDARDSRIGADLAAAEQARQAADSTEEAYRARMTEARSAALKLTAAAKHDSARATEHLVGEADESIRRRVEAAEARLREQAAAAGAEIDRVAAEAARDIVVRLGGVSVSDAEATDAVKAVIHG